MGDPNAENRKKSKYHEDPDLIAIPEIEIEIGEEEENHKKEAV